ncbi:hypothetical protein B0H67DRAFT_650552 [Lasiosphaeris hirsuta]|uniref:Protein kinase domain-containing protein n=1 Tax=Lasiosphaeris hirsuta TaxID=260670 RepID=A0AA40DHT1_9PEZI|nr:hypothetical protein B0H67DRAFT_650552 [Lasiosphaeris hirsuta]
MASSTPAAGHEAMLARELEDYRPRRTQRYVAVNVLLLYWEDDDIGCAGEITVMGDMFRQSFNYAIWPYKIPSQDPEMSLNLKVVEFVSSFGQEDSLIIVYYGGHGGPRVATKSPCTWAAKIVGGPSLDWSAIQPQLTVLAPCDVVIFLDCCFAGQAARGRTNRYVELLAATDKDQMTPTGQNKWPSFTKVLTAEMKAMLGRDGVISLPAIHSRMVEETAGLQRQPFYVCLSGRDGSAGSIKLSRFGAPSPARPPASLGSVCLRLSLMDSLDMAASAALVKWLTRDSPSSVQDISLVDQALSDAQDARNLYNYLLPPGDRSEASGSAAWLPILSEQGRRETEGLLSKLRRAFSNPDGFYPASTSGIRGLISDVKQATANLMSFVTDSVGDLNDTTLDQLEHRSAANPTMDDLKSRIAMRLTLVNDKPASKTVRVNFSSQPEKQQRLRVGRVNGNPVMVEYVYYDEDEEKKTGNLGRQVSRISALHAEPKTPAFRSFHGMGVVREDLCGPRFGFVYSLPDHLSTASGPRRFALLSDLMAQVRTVPLEARIAAGRALCDAVLHLHSIGWYHKNLKSDNIIIFAGESEGWDFADPYLIGFDCSRPSDAETGNTVDFSTKDNIYRHPDRWGRSARFDKRHDLYALGILLLELGCWRTLPNMDAKRKGFEDVRDPSKLHDFLLKAAAEKLPHAAGTKYSQAILACLAKTHPEVDEGWQWQKLVREKVLGCLVDVSVSA